jgi:hypothetical protein
MDENDLHLKTIRRTVEVVAEGKGAESQAE